MEFYSLKISQITTETPDTVTIALEVPDGLRDIFQYKPGQHLTVRGHFEGHELRRSYSMSSAPHEAQLAVTVKKVAGGRMSTWLNEQLRVGDVLEVAPPEGRFTVALDPDKRRTYFFFAAGSGITPVFSLLKSVLETEPMSTIYLLYGSRDEENIIFREALDRLAERYQGQFNLEYMLSRPKKSSSGGGLFGFFKKTTTNWQGKTGRIDTRRVAECLDENLVQGPEHEAQYFICGPGAMADAVKAAILGRGLESKQIHTEHFVNASHLPGEAAPGAAAAAGSGDKKIVVHLKGQRIEAVVAPNMTILDTLIREKHDPPYSCTAGACATCMAKVLSGKVAMDACYALDDSEIKAGYVLTCQSRPQSEDVELSYDL